MPYNDSQVRLFQMAKHGKIHRKGLSPGKASKILAEAGQTHSSGHPQKKRGRASRALGY
jgi:hypothetical protein